MTTQTFNPTKTIETPSLADAEKNLKRDIFRSLHVMMPGIIQSFSGGTSPTAVVQVVFQRLLTDGSTVEIPVLLDCPVATTQGGGGSLRFPIRKGDECEVHFADRALDTWFEDGGQSVPFSSRCHDLSDAIVRVGLNSQANPLGNAYLSDETSLDYDGARVGLKGGMVTIQNQTQSLLTALDALIVALTGSTQTDGSAFSSGTITALNAVKTQLDALLY